MLAGRIVLLVSVIGTVASAAACSGDSRPPGSGSALTVNAASVDGSGGSSATAGGAGGASGGSAAGGMAGQAGQLGDGGSGLQPPDAGVCGDGSVGLTEECEPEVELVATCSSLGFEGGALRCGADCLLDTSGCFGTERCADGRDNDGDGRVDCSDADCEAACAQSCEEPELLVDGASITASIEGRAAQLKSSCAGPGAGGPELVVEVTAETTGRLDARVSGRGLLALSLRTACADDASEVACTLVDQRGGLSIDVVSGQVLFAVIEGYSGQPTGNVTLEVASRPANVCGDAFVDDAEDCDDGGQVALDGCSPTCQVEVTETEPNDSPDDAEPYAKPTYAVISPEGDADYYSLVLERGPKAVTIDVRSVGSGFCSGLEIDPYLELFDADAELIAEDDDGGEGYCSSLVVPALDDGEYLVVVRRSESASGATRSTFGYELSVSTD